VKHIHIIFVICYYSSIKAGIVHGYKFYLSFQTTVYILRLISTCQTSWIQFTYVWFAARLVPLCCFNTPQRYCYRVVLVNVCIRSKKTLS